MNSPTARATTGIEGFDFASRGGLPAGRPTLLTGAPGTGKTVFCMRFVLHGIEELDEPAVIVPFEESPEDLRRAAASLGWDLGEHERSGMLRFVDATRGSQGAVVATGGYDLEGLIKRIEHAIAEIGARRVVVDALSTLFSYLPGPESVRSEMSRIRAALVRADVTSIVTAERDHASAALTRDGVEAFVNDSVVVLRNRHDGRQRSRTVAIAKFRAADHQQGEIPFTIRTDEGIAVTPLSAMQLEQQLPGRRITTGIERLDELVGGGFFESSSVLVSGSTGTGKTLMASHFLSGVRDGGRSLMLGFEESRTQILRDADGWGLDLRRLEEQGRCRVVSDYPETMALEEHLLLAKREVEAFAPDRVAIDSLTALQRIGTVRGFREFVLGLISFLKSRQTTLMMTSTAGPQTGGDSVTQSHVSSIADGIILLRYLERVGRIDRAITTLKLRGTDHDRAVRAFEIDGRGMRIGEPLEVDAEMLVDGEGSFGGRIT